jgi:hypothetical protein
VAAQSQEAELVLITIGCGHRPTIGDIRGFPPLTGGLSVAKIWAALLPVSVAAGWLELVA